ncbi:adenine nucleotide alpha hydrolase family protein [Lederbergia lenta]|uniref:Osmosensitive K+ channel histidine kinase n=1 Tax=Lederbergia lenta TaxID=1467 RepID=A0A2X4VUW4_LEDLE|nr:histidine kinase [Lederbergia lenta]MCM3111413.1 histidine kinase [Lederbergia lenta]MEC2325201.1 histidine kinase [Lederbergia lenta]SQI56037.1 osmosensitive K+ channel histidine kinase [Lederbergia lenta]
MKKVKGRMDECILVCVYYGPNGERLIRRGHKMASIMDCPLYVLTVDPLPYDEFDAEKSGYVDSWKELVTELDIDEFILKDNEKRPSSKVIAEVAHHFNITQIIIGQTAQSRWEEITKGSFLNVLLRDIPFVDFHVVSIDRSIKSEEEEYYEKGVRGYLVKDGDNYQLSFSSSKQVNHEGIFYKEIGTDFNNGVFKFMKDNKTCQVHITDDKVTEPIHFCPYIKEEVLKK